VTGPAASIRHGTVEALGWRTWDALLPLLDHATCAWADLDGFHVAAAPAAPPISTHLWAWRQQWWLRARLDTDRVVAGVLTFADHLERVHIRHALTWASDEHRVGPLDPAHLTRGWLLLELAGERPVTFVGDPATLD